MNKYFYNATVSLVIFFLVFCGCQSDLTENSSEYLSSQTTENSSEYLSSQTTENSSEYLSSQTTENSSGSSSEGITENSSGNVTENSSSEAITYYVEHFEDTPVEDYHVQIFLGAIKPFDEGDTVKLDDLLQYYQTYCMKKQGSGELLDEIKPYSANGYLWEEVKVPKQIVVETLSKRFAVKIDSETSAFQDSEEEKSLKLFAITLDLDAADPGVSKKVKITDKGDITVIRFDELKREKIENEGSVNHKVYFSKLCEAEIGIKNYGTDEAQFMYYKRIS